MSNARVLTLVVIHRLIGTGNAGYFIFYNNIIKREENQIYYTNKRGNMLTIETERSARNRLKR